MYISFTKPNHNKKYERTWNGIYHYLLSDDSITFRTECGLKKRFDECFSVTPTEEEPKSGWLCMNCHRALINLANKPYEEQYAN